MKKSEYKTLSDSQKAKIETHFNNHLTKYLNSDHLFDNNSEKLQLLRTIYKALIILKDYTAATNVDIDYDNPSCQFLYEVPIKLDEFDIVYDPSNINFDFDLIKKRFYTSFDLLRNSLSGMDDIRNLKLFDKINSDLIKIINTDKSISVFSRKSNKFIFRNQPIDKINSLLSKEDQLFESRINILSDDLYDLIFKNDSLTDNSQINSTSNKLGNILHFTVSCLTFDLENNIAYYPLNIGFTITNKSNDNNKKRQAFDYLWNSVMNVLENHITFYNSEDEALYKSLTKLSFEDETFAIPCNPFMYNIYAMFLGLSQLINRKLLEISLDKLTSDQKVQREKYLNSIYKKGTEVYFDKSGQLNEKNIVIAITSDNPIIKSYTELEPSLFDKNPLFQESTLAKYINITFGSEGLRHLLGILIGLDEAGRTGRFIWNVNDHLKRLGYKKQKNRGTYPYELKQTAIEVMKIFTSFFITVERKDAKGTGVIKGKRLFYIEGYEKNYLENWVTNETYTIKATDYWYNNSLSVEQESQQFTKLMKEVAKENHQKHAFTIYLAPLLAIFWRMGSLKKKRELSLENLLKWLGIDFKNQSRKRFLKKLSDELNYMVEKRYLGNWGIKNDDINLIDITDPKKYIMFFEPPSWLTLTFENLNNKRTNFLEKEKLQSLEKDQIILSPEELKSIIDSSGLTQKEIAEKIGISSPYISLLKQGKREITREISTKIRHTLGN
jgi:predicted XRE-type DNA-binding protein